MNFMLHVPYRCTASSFTYVITGDVEATFAGAPAVLPYVKSGRSALLVRCVICDTADITAHTAAERIGKALHCPDRLFASSFAAAHACAGITNAVPSIAVERTETVGLERI
jgi:hypothetical protein